MNLPIPVHSNDDDVESQLTSLGLTKEILQIAVSEGQASRNTATSHHPANAGGTFAFLEVVRSLRDQLTPQGWKKKNVKNLSLTVNEDLNLAIAVSGGSQETGQADGYPTTRNTKGETTKQYLEKNNQLDLFPIQKFSHEEEENDTCLKTWLLLYYYDKGKNEVRSEISLPTETTVNGKVGGWKTRILLAPIPLDGQPIKVEPDYSPDIDIDVQFRR